MWFGRMKGNHLPVPSPGHIENGEPNVSECPGCGWVGTLYLKRELSTGSPTSLGLRVSRARGKMHEKKLRNQETALQQVISH